MNAGGDAHTIMLVGVFKLGHESYKFTGIQINVTQMLVHEGAKIFKWVASVGAPFLTRLATLRTHRFDGY